MEIYVVRPGDTVDSIAESTGADLESLLYINQLVYPYRLAVGQALLILRPDAGEGRGGEGGKSGSAEIAGISTGEGMGGSGGKTASGQAAAPGSLRPGILSGGYAYPFISPWVLSETLPYMTEISVFSYGFTADGRLIPPVSDDTWIVREAWKRGVKPVLTLTPLGADGLFNNYLVTALVEREDTQLNLLRDLVRVMAEKGYAGVNIDFEYILPEDRDAFTEFVGRAVRMLNQFEYEVSVALVPKTSDDQPGLLYEGMDYKGLGEAANSVFLMTYEWGYSFSPPMAVAPVNQVRRVVEYALTRIPAERICLGVPNYGYDWPLPYVSGTTKAATIGNVEAVQLAILHGAEILYDETARSPYFTYWQYGVRHEVWFEDVRSYAAKFSLVKEYALRGIGVWQVMQLFRAGWELSSGYFR